MAQPNTGVPSDRPKTNDFLRELVLKVVPGFPSQGSVYDFCVHKKSLRWVPWTYKIPKFRPRPPAIPPQDTVQDQESVVRYHLPLSKLDTGSVFVGLLLKISRGGVFFLVFFKGGSSFRLVFFV